ncbi:hypothetical protein GCM10011374_32280 [Kocuria dechangensis]|uniref:Uncharacterized protein n=2 Tax=Kocuria dechangensis TaxID=1176249 RepID=A0A917LYQ0_9MICC|nr:hypothetical protein GCM10011374_32280 [Kocuria dechangensis]
MVLEVEFVLLSTVVLLGGIGWPPLHSWVSRRRRARRLRVDPHHALPRSDAPVLGPVVLIAVGLGLLVVSAVV